MARKSPEPPPFEPQVILSYQQLMTLLEAPKQVTAIAADVKRLRQEIDGINGRLTEIIDRIADLASMI